MIWIITEKNIVVTEYYFNILKKSAEYTGNQVIMTDNVDYRLINRKKDLIIVGTITRAYSLLIKGYRNIIVWFQGISPEESFMRHSNKLKKKVLEYIEKYVLKNAKFKIFVSNEMKVHYETKYQFRFNNDYYIMPCYNTKLIKKSFEREDKYTNNVFVYAGSLSVWQGFDKILKIYEEIENSNISNTKLLILTPDKEEATNLINKTKIKNFEINYSEPKDLPNIISQAKFGFIIRENNLVNRVATPTKLSTYLANGIIPIYNETLKDFHESTKKLTYKINIDNPDYYETLLKFMNESFDYNTVLKEYNEIFNTYYNSDFHINMISKKLLKLV